MLLLVVISFVALVVTTNGECPVIPKSDPYIKALGKDCFKDPFKANEVCNIHCPNGFLLKDMRQMNTHMVCLPNNTWLNYEVPKCIDYMPPEFSNTNICNGGKTMQVDTLLGKDYALVKFDNITAIDNSGRSPNVACFSGYDNKPCQYEFGKEYKMRFGQHYIRFRATDQSGNYRECRYRITVEDNEIPRLLSCPGNINKEVDLDNSNKIRIHWKQPEYIDNVDGTYVRVYENIPSGSTFYIPSTRTVSFKAYDSFNNVNEECKFVISLKYKSGLCQAPRKPKDGAVVYNKNIAMQFCRLGYAPPKMSFLNICKNGKWVDIANPSQKQQFGDCIKGGGHFQFFQGNCNQIPVQSHLKNTFRMMMGMSDDGKSININCGTQSS